MLQQLPGTFLGMLAGSLPVECLFPLLVSLVMADVQVYATDFAVTLCENLPLRLLTVHLPFDSAIAKLLGLHA